MNYFFIISSISSLISISSKEFSLTSVSILFNDDFIVEIRLIECDITLKFNYILLSKDNQIIAKASTTQVAVTLNKETLYAIPDELKFALNQ